MHQAQPMYPRGSSAPAEQFGRVARTIPLPHRLAFAATDSANAASLTESNEVDATRAVAHRATDANGFGDAAPGARSDALDSHALQMAARQQRARRIGALAAALLRSAAAHLRDWRERYRRGVEAQAIYRSLAELDARTLSDLGIHHRGELRSIAQRLALGEDVHGMRGQR